VVSILHSHCLEVLRSHTLVLARQVLGLVSDSEVEMESSISTSLADSQHK